MTTMFRTAFRRGSVPASPRRRTLLGAMAVLPAVAASGSAAAQAPAAADDEPAHFRQARAAVAANRKALFEDPDTPVGGNPRGDLTVVEFFDYRCSHCKRAAPAVAALLERDAGVKLIFREFPILGATSLFVARAALAAHRLGRYRPFHDALMKAEPADEAAVKRIAGELGIDPRVLAYEMEQPEIMMLLRRTVDVATAIGVDSTPSFVIGGIVLPGIVELETLQRAVQYERARAARK